MVSGNYAEDNRLDIVILGPMDERTKEDPSTGRIRQALEVILAEPEAQEILQQKHVSTTRIYIPEDWKDQEIIAGVLSRLDIADLVVLNLTPKDGIPSPNVYYELGLVHALGLPYMLIYEKGNGLPFYTNTLRSYGVDVLSVQSIKNELQQPFMEFLRQDGETDFSANRVSQFYDGLPILDISAAVGLATSYYHNFVGRILREGSFVTTYPDKVKHLVIVRPAHILDTYEQDMELLRRTLVEEGFELGDFISLPQPPGDPRGPAHICQINGIVIDLPRAIYPLKISPRLLTMRERFDRPGHGRRTVAQSELLLRQASERLLDRVEQAIRYHVNKENNYRKSNLHFSRMVELPDLLQRLMNP